MNTTTGFNGHTQQEARWYDLFSRGARDWLRHNEKVRDAVRKSLPDLISSADILGSSGNRKVQVPVRFLEHYRFRLRDPESQSGVGQGDVEPGDVLRESQSTDEGQQEGGGGTGEGGVEFMLELRVDDIVDWLWEELQLPHLRAKAGAAEEDEYTREGWDRKGARSRLDRRRSVKEAIKRRAVQSEGPAFTNEDLRFRQLVKRTRPATRAAVFFVLDVSSSMGEHDRQLAKTFFFWVVQGLRRQYKHIDTVFVGHTTSAWEFSEEEFFKVKGYGGTIASTAFSKVSEIIAERYDPAAYNLYIFYASDGENYRDDRDAAMDLLFGLGPIANYLGYVETARSRQDILQTETALLFDNLKSRGHPAGSFPLSRQEDVWDAIRGFFTHQAEDAA